MIESLLFIAILFPIALPPIVIDATKAVMIKETNNKLISNLLDNTMAIDAEVEPLMIPHISPITSLQKLDTFSAFFINFTPNLAPLTFLEAIELKVFSSATVILTPIISNNIPKPINTNIKTKLMKMFTLGIIVSDNKEKNNDIKKVITVIFIIQL